MIRVLKKKDKNLTNVIGIDANKYNSEGIFLRNGYIIILHSNIDSAASTEFRLASWYYRAQYH